MPSSGVFWPGTVSAVAHTTLPPFDPTATILSVHTSVACGSTNGYSSGTGASCSFYNSGCGVTYSAVGTTTVTYRASDGVTYTSNYAADCTVSGNQSAGVGVLTIALPVAGTQTNDPPAGASGGCSVPSLTATLRDDTDGIPVALPAIVYQGTAWSVAFPTLSLTHQYTLTVTASYGNCYSTPAPVTRTFTLPSAYYRYATWAIVSTIGPSVDVGWGIVSQVGGYVYPAWGIVTQIDSPTSVDATPASIAAALAPLHRFRSRVYVKWDRVNWTEESDRLLSASGIEDVDLARRYLNTAACDLTLDNGDDRYSAANRVGPLAAYLARNGQEIKVVAGYNGNEDVVFYGMVDSMSASTTDRTMVLRCLDRSALWKALKTSYPYSTGVRPDQVAGTMLTWLGLVSNVDYILDVCESNIIFAMAGDTPLWDELRYLAEAEGGRVFFDRTGMLRLWSRSHHIRASNQPVVELDTDNHAYALSRGTRPSGMANRVTMTYPARSDLVPAQLVNVLPRAVRIPAGRTVDNDPVPHGKAVAGDTVNGPLGCFAGSVTYSLVITAALQAPGVFLGAAWLSIFRNGVLVERRLVESTRGSAGTVTVSIVKTEETYGEWSGSYQVTFGAAGAETMTGTTVAPTTTRTYTPSDPLVVTLYPLDLTSWEPYLPSELTSWTGTCNTAANGGGSAVTMVNSAPPAAVVKTFAEGITGSTWDTHGAPAPEGWDSKVYYEVELFQKSVRVTLSYFGPTDVYLVTGAAYATVARLGGPVGVTQADPDSIAAYGELELVIDNPYLPEATTAVERVREELAARKDPLLVFEVPLTDGLPFLKAFDVIRFTDRTIVNQPQTTDGQVLRNSWSMSPAEGYAQSLLLAPAVTGTYRTPTAGLGISATATMTTAVAAASTWGPDADALVWSLGEWG